jgi:hypothetical protein
MLYIGHQSDGSDKNLSTLAPEHGGSKAAGYGSRINKLPPVMKLRAQVAADSFGRGSMKLR